MPDFADIKISGTAEVRAALERVSWRSLDLTAPLSVLGDEVKEIFEQSFATETSPSGEPWAPLKPKTTEAFLRHRKPAHRVTSQQRKRRRTKSRTRRGAEHILQAASEPGWLARSLAIRMERYSVEISEPSSAAGRRAQHGDPREGTPPRPFVEVTPHMEERAAQLLSDYFGRRWHG